MPEVLWEIWHQKRNVHHRVSMDFNETPQAVFQRIMHEFQGTEKALPTIMLDPNTGKEVKVMWDYSFRSRGQESKLAENVSFAHQGVGEGSLIVARSRDIRAHTIYIDGTAGLVDEELRATRSKWPLLIAMLILLLGGGGAAWYFMVHLPEEQRKAPHIVKVPTTPAGASVSIILDMQGTPQGKVKRFISIKEKTPKKKIPIPKKAKVVYFGISKEGYKTWKRGYTIEEWSKDRRGPKKLEIIYPKEFTIPGEIPDELDKLPPKPKYKTLKAPAPKFLSVKYPRRFRYFRVGLDPLHGGDEKGVKGTSGKTASELNLLLAKTSNLYLRKVKRRRFRVYLTRKKDKNVSDKRRARKVRYTRAVVQFDFAVGFKEFAKASKNDKKDGTIIPYNDSVAGFKVLWADKGRAKKKSKKLAGCLAGSMQKAGFIPHRIGYAKPPKKKDDDDDDKVAGVVEFDGESAVLGGRAPAVRLIVGYLSHRAEEKVLLKAETHVAIASAIADATVCLKKR